MVEVCYPNLSKWSVYCFAVLLFHKFYHNKCTFHLATGANLWTLLGPSKNATSATSAKPRDGSFLRWQRWWAHCTWNRHSMFHNPDFAPNKGILRRAQYIMLRVKGGGIEKHEGCEATCCVKVGLISLTNK